MNLKVLLIVIAIINFILPLGITPLFDLDEGAFSEATREMLASKNYITTYLDGALRFDKPILIYWLQAFSVKIFGLNEFALRLPSAIAGLFWAYFIYIFTKRVYNKDIAYYATLFMISALQINLIAKAAIADSLLNLFIALSIFSAWLYLDTNKNKYLYLSFASIGLGTLTKGPVAIMVPLISIFIFMLMNRQIGKFFKTIFNPLGIVIFLAIALPWYILEYIDQGQKFIDGFFLKHNIQRFNSAFESHKGSIFYYIPVVILGVLPFSSILLKTILKIKDILVSNLELFLIIWFLFVFVFFSFSGTKLPHYVIYGYTPLFILMGVYASKNLNKLSFFDISFVLALYIILFALPFLSSYIEPKNQYIKDILDGVKDSFDIKYLIFIAFGFGATIIVYKINLNIKYKSAIFALIFTALINFVVIASYGNLVQQPLKDAAIYAKKHNLKVIRHGITMPSFLVYLEDKSLKEEPKKGSVVLTKSKSLNEFKSYEVLFNKNGIYLIKLK